MLTLSAGITGATALRCSGRLFRVCLLRSRLRRKNQCPKHSLKILLRKWAFVFHVGLLKFRMGVGIYWRRGRLNLVPSLVVRLYQPSFGCVQKPVVNTALWVFAAKIPT